MIRVERVARGRVRVIGSLTGNAVQVLLDAVDGGATAIDLSEVALVDDSAVQVLARLRQEHRALVACPRWLELWLARVRRKEGV